MAESAADSTRVVDDETVWLDEQGDQVTASAFFEDETFVSVTGPADDVDRVLDLITEHANGPVQFFDPKDFTERFDLPEGIFDEGFAFDEDFFTDGEFPGLDEEAMEDFRAQMDEFSQCMRLELDQDGASASIEIPDCDLPGIEGLVGPGLGDLFDGEQFGDLFDNDALEDLLDDVLDDAS